MHAYYGENAFIPLRCWRQWRVIWRRSKRRRRHSSGRGCWLRSLPGRRKTREELQTISYVGWWECFWMNLFPYLRDMWMAELRVAPGSPRSEYWNFRCKIQLDQPDSTELKIKYTPLEDGEYNLHGVEKEDGDDALEPRHKQRGRELLSLPAQQWLVNKHLL